MASGQALLTHALSVKLIHPLVTPVALEALARIGSRLRQLHDVVPPHLANSHCGEPHWQAVRASLIPFMA